MGEALGRGQVDGLVPASLEARGDSILTGQWNERPGYLYTKTPSPLIQTGS